MGAIRVRNWGRFQHYKRRVPPWIKLHRGLLDNVDWFRLQLASRALAPCIWLLASESEAGEITDDLDALEFRLRAPRNQIAVALKDLEKHGFVSLPKDFASTTLARRSQHACIETETEAETEGDNKTTRYAKRKRKPKPSHSKQTLQPGSRKASRRPPKDFEITENMRVWAEKTVPNVDADKETDKFLDHEYATPKRDWPAAWRRWMRKADEYRPAVNKAANGSAQHQATELAVDVIASKPLGGSRREIIEKARGLKIAPGKMEAWSSYETRVRLEASLL